VFVHSPRLASPRLASARLASPRLASARLASARLALPRLASPRHLCIHSIIHFAVNSFMHAFTRAFILAFCIVRQGIMLQCITKQYITTTHASIHRCIHSPIQPLMQSIIHAFKCLSMTFRSWTQAPHKSKPPLHYRTRRETMMAGF